MTYECFEDLPVWKEAILLIEEIYRVTSLPGFRPPASFKSQLERAGLSVSNNIAEGFERGTNAELISFLYIARGSSGEVRSMLRLGERNKAWGVQTGKAIDLALSCSKQIRTWAQYLQDTPLKGQRYITKAEQEREEAKKRVAAFQKKLLQNLPESHPLRAEARQREIDAMEEREERERARKQKGR